RRWRDSRPWGSPGTRSRPGACSKAPTPRSPCPQPRTAGTPRRAITELEPTPELVAGPRPYSVKGEELAESCRPPQAYSRYRVAARLRTPGLVFRTAQAAVTIDQK